MLICMFRLERLPLPVFAAFLDVLDQVRGSFLRSLTPTLSAHISDLLWQRDAADCRHRFEVIDRCSVTQIEFDSAELVSVCRLE
jgi:hypothetical protein